MKIKLFASILLLSFLTQCTPGGKETTSVSQREKDPFGGKIKEFKILDTLPLFDTKNDVFIQKKKQFKSPYKLVTYIDGSCFTCAKDFVLWKDFIKSVKDGNNVEFIFFFHTIDLDMFKPYFKRWRFFRNIYIDEKNIFKNVNKISEDKSSQTYLLDQNNKVLGIGNPIYSEEIKEKYILIFNGSGK